MAAAKKTVETTKHKVSLNLDTMTLGDMEAFEDATGKTVDELLSPKPVLDENGRKVPDPDDPKGRPLMEIKMSMKALVGLAYVALRKENPDITIQQVRDMPLDDFDFDVEEGEADPTATAEQP